VAPVAVNVNPALPTVPPVATYLPPTRAPGTPIASPTADAAGLLLPTFTPLPVDVTQTFATSTAGPQSYTVQPGDYPGSIAAQFDITVDELLGANQLTADSIIYPGDTLLIPGTNNQDQQAPIVSTAPQLASSDFFKIIPDSELVYGPLGSLLDVESFVQKQGGYLSYYTQAVDGETLTGAQILKKVAENYSVNPRLLLAVLEYRSQWVTNPNPAASTYDYPIGYVDDFHTGFYRQMTWTANALNEGFYRWQEHKIQNWTLVDDTTVVAQPGINAGTAAVQDMFSYLDDQATWKIDTGANGVFASYSAMFGYPFDFAIEPFLPRTLTQPLLNLPFGPGESWQFTGGPHGGWDSGSAWAAIDFAPPGEPNGCGASDFWITAVGPGLIIRAKNGAVVQDLDGDGLEQTGWTILYMHVEARERVIPGQFVQAGQKIGHPSCEGGQSYATHLHIARRYNGMWIPAADPGAPLVLDGYVTSGNDTEYDGWLTKGDTVIEAWDGHNALNQITR
jgi:LysM repeat protein